MSVSGMPGREPRILVVQPSDEAPGGRFCRGLLERGANLTCLRPMDGDALPDDTENFDGLVVLGGPQSSLDDLTSPYFPSLMLLMRLFDDRKKPVAGICLGCQLLARAYGGQPKPLGFLEFGFVKHKLTAEGWLDPVVGGGDLPALMEFHEDSFDFPPGGRLLIRGERCVNQCFRIGHASFGFQFHLEADDSIVRNWIDLFRGEMIENYSRHLGEFDESCFDELSEGLDRFLTASEQFCDGLTERWLALAACGVPH